MIYKTLKRVTIYKDGKAIASPMYPSSAETTLVTLSQLMPEHRWTSEAVEIPNPNWGEADELALALRALKKEDARLKKEELAAKRGEVSK